MKKLILATSCLLACGAGAKSQDKKVPKLGASYEFMSFSGELEAVNKYQLGDEWGKKPVTSKETRPNSPIAKIVKATASLGGATSFLLGRFNGEFVMATNHHVCPRASACEHERITFPVLRKKIRVDKVLGTWPEIDLALFTIKVDSDDEAELEAVASPFDFKARLKPGELLATVGFGIAENPETKLVFNMDDDCKVFSDEDDFHLMADPDTVNPGKYKAWSFANGCDVSHGDSGSAFIDRKTGSVMGIVWTGRIPKDPKVQHSDYLNQMLSSHSEEIWTELTYAVPAVKISEILNQKLSDGDIDDDAKPIIEEMLQK